MKNPGVRMAESASVAVGDKVSVKSPKSWPTTSTVEYTSDTPEVATVDPATGMVTGVKAGTAKITAKLVSGTKTVSNSTTVTVTNSAYTINMTSLTATAADTLVAKFDSAVNRANTTLTLKRGTTSVNFKETWNADGTEVTIKTDAKMTAGTYELTAADKTDATVTSSKTVVVEAQKAVEIKILNDVALTGTKNNTDGMEAYVYYDVLDQYGESMRSSVSITWSSSAKVATRNTASGMLTLERTDNRAFTYGEQIFITGVNTRTGLNVSKTLTVGAQQAVNSVVMKGFIKKGTTEILDRLPKDFKSEAYYMLFNILDQNGNDIRTDFMGSTLTEHITFVSDAPLIIKEMVKAGNPVTINDHEYNTVLVEPGIKVEDGGEVTVTAIANRTGNKTTLNVPVNMSEVLKSFIIGTPSDIVADGETVVLPFTATDTKGNTVTNFETIAKQETFNKLQLSVSAGSLMLKQNDDGTASLLFTDETMAWSNGQTTDGQDRIVSLTAVVVGGETNNQVLNIVDKARPTGVSGVNFNNAYVEGDAVKIDLYKKADSDVYISYVDQYGRPMTEAAVAAFFNAGSLSGAEFSGYTFGTLVTYNGNGNSELKVSGTKKEKFLTGNDDKVTIDMGTSVKNAVSGEGCKFAVVKIKNGSSNASYETLDRAKNYGYSVVDITQVKGFSIGQMNKIFVQTPNTENSFLAEGNPGDSVASLTGAAVTIPSNYDGIAYNDTKVTVSGTYAGKSIRIPAKYFKATAEKLLIDDTTKAINNVSGSAIKLSDLYNFSATKYNMPRKDGDDTITVVVSEIYSNGAANDGAIGSTLSASKTVTNMKQTVAFSDAKPEAVKIEANAEAVVCLPNKTVIDVTAKCENAIVNGKKGLFTLLNQYGKQMAGKLSYEVRDVVEAPAYADNNFALAGNATNNMSVSGAERLDTFTIVASYNKLNASVKVTVGADVLANINNNKNSYLEDLIKASGGLEDQRKAGLQ